MSIVANLLDSRSGNIRIVETGYADTVNIACWVAEKCPEAEFESVDLDGRSQEAVHRKLEETGFAQYYAYHTQAPNKFLAAQSWIDAAFLNPPDLQSGLEEFCFAVSAGASLIVVRDYQTRAALAVQKAKNIGWTAEFQGPYSILRRI